MVSILVVSAQKFIDNWGAIRGNIIDNLLYDDEEYVNAVKSMPLTCCASIEELSEWLHGFVFRDLPATINDKGLLIISNVRNQEDLFDATHTILSEECAIFDLIKV